MQTNHPVVLKMIAWLQQVGCTKVCQTCVKFDGDLSHEFISSKFMFVPTSQLHARKRGTNLAAE
jgi:hypothetical protein